MKADHRKQLEKNELLDRLQKWWRGTGEPTAKKSSTFWVVVGAAALVVVLIFAWRYYSDTAQKNRAAAWKQIEQAFTPEELESIADANRGTTVGWAAKTQLARMSLNEGLRNLASNLQRSKGVAEVEKARSLYNELAGEAKKDEMTRREALLGAAKAEESLVGVPKGDNATESRGSLDRALELYEQAARDFAESPQGKQAAERAKDIRDNREKVLKFYEELNKRFVRSEVPPPPPFEPNPKFPSIPSSSSPSAPSSDAQKTPLLPPPGGTKPETPKPADSGKPLTPPPDSKPKDTKPVDAKPGDPKTVPPLTPPKDPAQPAPKSEPPKPTDKPKDKPKDK